MAIVHLNQLVIPILVWPLLSSNGRTSWAFIYVLPYIGVSNNEELFPDNGPCEPVGTFVLQFGAVDVGKEDEMNVLMH